MDQSTNPTEAASEMSTLVQLIELENDYGLGKFLGKGDGSLLDITSMR